MRLKGGACRCGKGWKRGAPPNGAAGGNGVPEWQGRQGGEPGGPEAGILHRRSRSGQGWAGGFGGARGNGGPPDFQQMLARMPAVSISELNKGDAVMLVATEGSAGSGPTAITLLAGVEPILTAAPAGMNAAATVLSPWNLGQGGAGVVVARAVPDNRCSGQ